ncbi:hypothetical protein FXN61_08905 [Lentzea sp. PSKA42]|uniref:DUF5666 domain-containing protein n=1 Tax=Lentzea indica TaxID=2604800 RepID=A0ABX1FDD9_9PSEU|nr:hypothetical protein [Lentzea indica]NKE56948.1 hypothetical protein [Lentzea indica]
MSTALLVLSLTSPAAESDEVGVVQSTSPATSVGKTVSVSCPSGTKVVGTGGSVTGERTTITRVRPGDDLTSVEVTAVEHGAGTVQPWTVTVRANCAPGEFTLVSKSGTKNAEAACPGNQKALGVAGETAGGHFTKMAPKNNLKGGVIETSGNADVTAHAICGTRPGLVLRGGSPSVVMTKTASKSVACQGDEQVVSAGGAVAGAIIDDVVPAGSGATVTGEGTDAQGQAIRWSITPYVVCSQ